MNKQEFVTAMARDEKIPIWEASKAYEQVFQALGKYLSKGEEIKIRNFGTFCVRKHKPKAFKDFNTGQKKELPAHFRPVFIPSGTLKEKVQNGGK